MCFRLISVLWTGVAISFNYPINRTYLGSIILECCFCFNCSMRSFFNFFSWHPNFIACALHSFVVVKFCLLKSLTIKWCIVEAYYLLDWSPVSHSVFKLPEFWTTVVPILKKLAPLKGLLCNSFLASKFIWSWPSFKDIIDWNTCYLFHVWCHVYRVSPSRSVKLITCLWF